MNATQTTITQTVDDPPFTVQDRRRKGFFTVDNELYDRFGSELGPYGLAVYIGLARFANQESECFPSQSTLAKRAGMSRMQVSREIDKLKALKLVAVENQFGPKGQKRANLYILLDLPHVTDSDIPYNRELHKQNNSSNNIHKEQDKVQQQRRRVNQSNDASPDDIPPSKQDVVVLTDLGISQKVAVSLAKRYSRDRILEKVTYLEFLQVEDPEKVQNPCGWLRSAIEENYAPPDGFITPAERERQQAEEAHKAQEEAEQAQASREASLAFREKKKATQEARRQTLSNQYGTTEEDFAFWEQAQNEITYTTPAHIAQLVGDMEILKVTDELVMVGVERADVWRQLQHPNIQKALNRALGCVTERDMRLVVEEIKTVGLL